MFTLKCSSYKEGAEIPPRYAHHTAGGGKNVSPGFSWDDPPTGTRSFAFSIIDPHPVAKDWVHWFLIDIPFSVRGLDEGASRTAKLPAGSRELLNSYNEMGYGGPAPPKGSGRHPYVATVYALNVPSLPLDKDTVRTRFLRTLEGKIIAEAVTTGTYEQK